MIPAQDNQESINLIATEYNRADCKIGVVHVGFGAFHRAHQAVYVDDYMEQTGDLNWGIAAVNLRPSESDAFDEVQRTKNGYLLKTTSPDGERQFRLVRSHCQFVDWSKTAKEAEELIALNSVHVVTVTVTESGYYLNDDWTLNKNDPMIASELAGGDALTVYGYLAKALKYRMTENGQPISILCCDNIRSNGKMLERTFLNYLENLGDLELLAWVQSNASFPSSMVDRITPRASDDLKSEVQAIFNDATLSPIHGEAFSQWVLEDKFKGAFPDLTKAGVEIVANVDPFEEAKIRILNGGHTGLCYFAALAGYETFDQGMTDPALKEFFDNYEQKEVLPGLDLELPFDRLKYLGKIADRFANRAIADQLGRICMDGYSKVPIYIRPTLASCLAQNIFPKYGFLCVASWYVYARRFAAGQMPIHYIEPYWDQLEPLLSKGNEEQFAQTKQLWGDLPDTYPDFVQSIVAAISEVEEKWPV
jgi:D-arabinitol 4-dehydrogenase